MAGPPPSGTVTFLLTDLEGSTRMWEQDPDAMTAAMVRHDELLEKTIAAHRGYVFARMGDGMAASFATATDAVCAAAAFQQALAAEPWHTPRPLRARVGLHTDEAVVVNDSYASQPVNRCSRLMTAAHGGQVVVSGATEVLMRGQLPDGTELVDLGEHRLRDLGRPTRILQLNTNGDREEFPPLRTLDSFPGNLPAQMSSFIGRKKDVSRVAAALGSSRVVTITGVGGVGKTRLALQVAADVLPRYRDGAWLVELAPVRDPDSVVEAVATVFRLTNRGALSLEDSLIEMLGQKRLLLVLDNCEHVLGPVARMITRIQRSCPGVSVLATSREGLAVEGEQLVALPPMEAGEPGEDRERLLKTDAVTLFVERARQANADFTLSDANRRAVVEACQRLDGLPLAIELAAARVIAMSPAEIVSRLDRRFQVLSGGRRGAVERHATLRAAIDWSYELLNPAEQRLLARLSVFPASFNLAAIEGICDGGPVQREDAIDLVTSLVARSLVVAEHHPLGTRYRLLETIRQYAEERLDACGESDTLTARHARFYADLSLSAAENSYGPAQLVWARRINLERDNVRAALANAIDDGNAALAVQLVSDYPHQRITESPTGAVTPIPASRVIGLPGAGEQPGYPRALVVAAYNTHAAGDFATAESLCRQAAEAGQRLPAPAQGPSIDMDVSHLRAMTLLAAGNYADAALAFFRAAELANTDGFPGLAALCLADGVNTALLGGASPGDLVARAEESVALARRSGMHGALVMSLNALALALARDNPQRSRALLSESLERATTPGEEVSSGLLTACLVAGRLRDWDLTLALTSRTMHLWRSYLAPLQTAPCLALCARALAEENIEAAGVINGAALAAFRALGKMPGPALHPGRAAADPGANFVHAAMRETNDMVVASVGDERRRSLRNEGAAMTVDEAVAYALATIDPRVRTGPFTAATVGRSNHTDVVCG